LLRQRLFPEAIFIAFTPFSPEARYAGSFDLIQRT
jgi:hypothetical protein